ncbi:CHASE2 domain-containing protein [Enhygromyxa salina]|uniref:CHASE2 domain protein n=1 Tax=Enhygromyxa salina TaxID=215803 RepID=A0A2S9YRH7_9BACT|nr:CHASE2 domain-containing protein [Enhygromyxa salina]PRQ07693.1 CHASE2 domain protein [Enhygromyxa salina]
MAKPRIETRTDRRAASPRELGILIRVAIVICGALLLVLTLDKIGLVGAIDSQLRERWVQLGEAAGRPRPTNSKVLLIAADHDTVSDPNWGWGPPPWPASRLEQLIEHIEPGAPVLLAEVGHTRMFESGPELDQVLANHPDVEMLITRNAAERASPWADGGLERGDMVLSKDSRLHLIVRAGSIGPIGERLPVAWMVPTSRLPVVPAYQVAADQVPPSTFYARIVLLGVTDPAYEMLLDTPVGRLSPAEIEAHALAGQADGAVWEPLIDNGYLLYTLGAGLALLWLWLFVRLRGAAAAVMVIASCVLILVLDFACYQRGWYRLGSAHALLTLGAVAISYWSHEAIETLIGLRQLRARVLRDATGGGGSDSDPDNLGFWEDLAELGAEYAQETIGGAAASTVIEREGNTWKLRVRASARLDADSHAFIAGREGLDLRRAPFRTPWLTLRAGWAVDVVPSGPHVGRRKTLIVPLEDDGELLGLWLVHMLEDLVLEREDCETFERLGRQMAGALVRRRERLALRDQATNARLRDHVETIVGGLRLLRDEHRWALELLEQLPVRALIATVWGEIEFIDPRLQADLKRRYPGVFSPDTPDDNLRTVLARLTGKSIEHANRLMRKVINDGHEIELDATPGIEDPGDDVWVLSRIRSKRGIDLPGFKPAVHEHILLMARSSAPAQTIRTRSGGLLRVLRGGSGKS